MRIDVQRPRSFWWIVAGLFAAVVMATLATVLALVNSEAARAAIERQLATYTGADIHYQALELHVWPRPGVELNQLTFRASPELEGAVERVVLRFALLPLLKGDAHISLAHLERPALVARISALGAAPTSDAIVAAYRAAVAPVLGWLALNARGLAFEVRDGSLDLVAPGVPALKFDGVTVDGEVSSDAVSATIEAHANVLNHARARTRIETGSLAADLELQIDGLETGPLLERALAASPVKILPAKSAVTLTANTDGARVLNAQLDVAMPGLAITRNGSRLDIGASHARMQATCSPAEIALVVQDLALGDLLPAATGSLKFQPGDGGTIFDAVMPRVDIGRVRAAALGFADDLGPIREFATFVQHGIALDLHAHVAGNGIEVLAEPFDYELSARVEAADVEVPALALRLSEASGSVRVAQRALSANGVATTIGHSSLRDGRITLALDPKVVLREMSAAFDVDLAESLALAKRVLRNSATTSAFPRIQSITGRARGTLALREAGGGMHQTYDVTSLQGTLRHAAVPLPIVIDGGGLRYEAGGQLALRGLTGAVGASHVERIDAVLALTPEPVVLSATGTAMLALDELYAWVVALPIARPLREDVSTLTGSVGVNLARLAGPLTAPERLDVVATLAPQQVEVGSPHLPEALSISGGTIRIEGAGLGFDGVGVVLQDARGMLSGSLHAYASQGRALDVSITHATLGPRSLEWAEDVAEIVPGARVRGPIALNSARVKWPAPAPWRFEVDAAAVFPSGAGSNVDLSWRPGSVTIRSLTLKDQDSDFRMVLDWQPESATVAFNGFVSERSIGRILVSPLGASGTLRGDFETTVDLRNPIRSRATGKLEGADLAIPTAFATPLLIDRLNIEANGDRFSVTDSIVRFGDEPIALAGSIVRAGDAFDVAADISSDGADAEQWIARLRQSNTTASASPWAWPLRGRVAIRVGHVDVLGYRVEPFVAAVALGDRKVTANVSQARLCGLSVPLTLSATPATVEIEGHASAHDLPVAATALCLTKNQVRASGTMDVSADFAASGAPAALLASARGKATVRARDGYVGGARALSDVLALEDVDKRLADAELNTNRDGLPYRAIELDVSLVGDRAVVGHALQKSAPIDIAVQGEIHLPDGQVALTGVALPIVNALARQVPMLWRIIGAPIVGIPFSVSGTIASPQVTRVRATAIGGALLHTLQSAVLLPVQLLDAVAGDAGARPSVPP